ncbi:MAG: S24/S26 family peptidase [Usitatibacter sp.]
MPAQSEKLLSGALEAGRNELAAASLRSHGRLRLAVTGTSMLPAVRPRDVLMIRACASDAVCIGDIVAYARDGRLFVHRVVGRAGVAFIAQGDALPFADPPVAARELLGRVVKVVRRGRAFRPALQPPLVARLAASLFRRSARAGRLFTRIDGIDWSSAR